MQLGLEGIWSRASLGGCGERHITLAQSVPSLGDATAVPGVSVNVTTGAGAETGWSTDPAGLSKKAAAVQSRLSRST